VTRRSSAVERRKREAALQSLWLLSDLLTGTAAFLLAYAIRFTAPVTGWIPPRPDVPPLSLYLATGAGFAVLVAGVLGLRGLYRVRRVFRPGAEAFQVASGALLAFLFGLALTFFLRSVSLSRIVLALAALLAVVLLPAGRWLAVRAVRGLGGGGRAVRAVLVGDGALGRGLASRIRRTSVAGQEWLGHLSASDAPSSGLPRLGGIADLPALLGSGGVDLVVAAPTLEQHPELLRLLSNLGETGADIELVPDLHTFLTHRSRALTIEGIPVLRLGDYPLAGWNGVVKRTFDVGLSLLLLVLFAPLFLAVALAVRLDSRGPVFYLQERVGRDGRRFRMVKFRSMRVDAEAKTGPVWARAGDARRTRLGGLLRRTSLDELPQLWNVLRGEMSLVGPRPERPLFVDQFEERIPRYFGRHRVKSGMTGWAQVHGLRGNTPVEERTRFDLYYVENWSLRLDLRILWMTVRAVLSRRNAY
jgi:exopolysaccharide biosynthesis polyprenyl glycosylphosphotransferase